MKKIFASLLLVLCLVSSVHANENLLNYTEVDSGNFLTKTANRVTFTDIERRSLSYLVKDLGANYFNGDFTHYFDLYWTSADLQGVTDLWSLSNVLKGSYSTLIGNDESIFARLNRTSGDTYLIILGEYYNGTQYIDSYVPSVATQYGATAQRKESVSTYGTLYLIIYNATRTTLLDTLSLTLHEKTDYRYCYAFRSYNHTLTVKISGWAQAYNLGQESRHFGFDICNGGNNLCY